MRGILDMFENPLTLGGMGLLSGGGWDGAMSGMRMGAGMQDRRRQQDAFDGLLSGSNVDQGMLPLLKAMGPEKGIEFLAQQRDPMRQMQLKQAQHELSMAPLDRQYKQAQINKLNRSPVDGETPANVREYEYFKRLSPEGQQQYLTMRRAQKMYDTGMEFVQPNAVNPAGPPVATIQKQPAEVERQKKLGEWEGGLPQRQAGQSRLSNILSGLASDYVTLNERGAIVNSDKGGLANIRARVESSGVGQELSGAVGSEAQSVRQRINNSRPLLLQSIMQATGMSARALDSNKELDFYLQSVSDPTRDLYSNLVALDALDKTFGLGGVLQKTLPPEMYQRITRDSDSQLAQRPINLGGPAAPVVEDDWKKSLRRID